VFLRQLAGLVEHHPSSFLGMQPLLLLVVQAVSLPSVLAPPAVPVVARVVVVVGQVGLAAVGKVLTAVVAAALHLPALVVQAGKVLATLAFQELSVFQISLSLLVVVVVVVDAARQLAGPLELLSASRSVVPVEQAHQVLHQAMPQLLNQLKLLVALTQALTLLSQVAVAAVLLALVQVARRALVGMALLVL
jgi:hypothetical protein